MLNDNGVCRKYDEGGDLMKKSVITSIVLAIVCAVLGIVCFAYQASINVVAESSAALRTITYYGLPVSIVLAVVFCVIAVVLAKKK